MSKLLAFIVLQKNLLKIWKQQFISRIIISLISKIGTDLKIQFRELHNRITCLQKIVEKMKEGEGYEKIDEESLAQNVASKIIINSPPLPMGESRLRFSELKLLKWKSSKSTTKRDMKMLSRILSKRNTVPVQLINAQEFEYNEIESSVREASAPRFRFNEIYKKGSFIMDSHIFKILELTVPATGGETYIRQLESSNASIYEGMGGKISLQFHRHSFANYEEASTSETKAVYNEESLEEEDTKRPMRMFQSRELRELYAQAETCDSPEELEKIMNEISQVQLGKKKRKILPYQAAKDEPLGSSSMDTGDGDRQVPPDGGHTIIQNITNNPTKIIREKNIKLPKGQAPTEIIGERSSQKYIPT
ncbi:hypothetical protein ACLB2K_063896 [Fragaria x ananassa]